MNKKKISIIALGISTLVVISSIGIVNYMNNNKTVENQLIENDSTVQVVEEKEVVINKTNDADLLIDYSKMENMLKECDVVAVVKINDAQGSNYNPVRSQYVPVYTTGTLQVKKVIKKMNDINVQENDQLDYVRLGGKIKYTEYLKGLTEAERNKIESVVNNNGEMKIAKIKENLVLNDMFTGDVQIETGKEYVVFLKYVDGYKKYNLVGFEHGLREYNSVDNTMKNNVTNEFESLNIVK